MEEPNIVPGWSFASSQCVAGTCPPLLLLLLLLGRSPYLTNDNSAFWARCGSGRCVDIALRSFLARPVSPSAWFMLEVHAWCGPAIKYLHATCIHVGHALPHFGPARKIAEVCRIINYKSTLSSSSSCASNPCCCNKPVLRTYVKTKWCFNMAARLEFWSLMQMVDCEQTSFWNTSWIIWPS